MNALMHGDEAALALRAEKLSQMSAMYADALAELASISVAHRSSDFWTLDSPMTANERELARANARTTH